MSGCKRDIEFIFMSFFPVLQQGQMMHDSWEKFHNQMPTSLMSGANSTFIFDLLGSLFLPELQILRNKATEMIGDSCCQ